MKYASYLGLLNDTELRDALINGYPNTNRTVEVKPAPALKQRDEEDSLDNLIEPLLQRQMREDKLSEIKIPEKPIPPQQRELMDAEQELRDEQELDKKSGADGYEAKEGGVFSRLKDWGSSVHDYLFGKDTRSEADKLADQVLEEYDPKTQQDKKDREEKGILGYYGDKLGKAMLGDNYKEDWEQIKSDANKEGLLGYIPRKGAEYLEAMARSPYAKFFDPTTALGGYRTEVEDIDKYFNNRGIGALRDDLMKQDAAKQKADTAFRQTKWGQFQDFLNASPEEQAAYIALQRAVGAKQPGSTASIKNEDNARMALREDFKEQNGRYPTADELSDLYRTYGLEKPKPKLSNYDQAILDRAGEIKAANPDIPWATALGQAGKEYDAATAESPVLANRLQRSYTRPPEEVEQIQASKNADAAWSKQLEDVMGKAFARPRMRVSALEAAKTIRANPQYVGGGEVGTYLRDLGKSLGLTPADYNILDAIVEDVKGDQMAAIIASQNSGSISDYERKLFARQCANLGAAPNAVIARLELYALSLKLSQDTQSYMVSIQNLPAKQRQDALLEFYEKRRGDVEKATQAILVNNGLGGQVNA